MCLVFIVLCWIAASNAVFFPTVLTTLPDWNFSCFIYFGVHPCIHIRDCGNYGGSTWSVQDMGTVNLLVDSPSAVNYLTLGFARETIQAKENNLVCC